VVGPIGLDVGRHTLKLAQIESARGRRRLVAVARTGTPDLLFDRQGNLVRPALLTAKLRHLLAEVGFRRGDAVVAVTGPRFVAHTLDLAAEAVEAELTEAVPAALGRVLPYPVDQAIVTYEPLPNGAGPGRRVAACAAPRATVEAVTAAVDAAGLETTVVDLAPFAAIYSLLAPHAPGARHLLGDLGASHTTWTLVDGHRVESVLPLPVGAEPLTERLARLLQLDARAVDSLKRTDLRVDGAEADGPAWEQPGAEGAVEGYVRAALAGADAARCSPYGVPLALDGIILYGAGAQLPGLAQRVAQHLGVPTQLGDGFASLGLGDTEWVPPEVARHAPAYVVSLGLAARHTVAEA
jgi:type IV pilus assembly protein PilM